MAGGGSVTGQCSVVKGQGPGWPQTVFTVGFSKTAGCVGRGGDRDGVSEQKDTRTEGRLNRGVGTDSHTWLRVLSRW